MGVNNQTPKPWDKNDVYKGESMNGEPFGEGRCKFANGDIYKGKWVNGQRFGLGTYKWNNGDKYFGN